MHLLQSVDTYHVDEWVHFIDSLDLSSPNTVDQIEAVCSTEQMCVSALLAAADCCSQRVDRIRVLYADTLKIRENAYASRFISGSGGLSDFHKHVEYTRRTVYELKVLGLNPSAPHERVLFAGCGSFPVTCLTLAHMGYSIVGLDSDPQAVHTAAAVARQASSSCAFVHSWFAQFSQLADFDVVIVAGTVGVSPAEKQEILSYLLGARRSGAKCCIRVPLREEILLMADVPCDLADEKLITFTIDFGCDYMKRLVLL